uniref:Uncharacterized protein n=1 Tax=Bionectria ochroleuca TaxID=29856 RepID=A0A8H7K8G9_BIOOC
MAAANDDNAWGTGLVDEESQDPEELRVIYAALDSFSQYAKVAHFNVTHLRRQSFYALPEAHWKMLAAPPFNFLETLEKTDDAIDSNAALARAIVNASLQNFGLSSIPRNGPVPPSTAISTRPEARSASSTATGPSTEPLRGRPATALS